AATQPGPVSQAPTRAVPMQPAPAPVQPAAPQFMAAQPVAPVMVPTSQPAGQSSAAQTPMVAFTCPHCRGVFQVPAALSGRQAHCPGCYQPIIVPNVAPRA